jgi:hypothetical protein
MHLPPNKSSRYGDGLGSAPAKHKDVSFVRMIQTGYEAHSPIIQWVKGILSGRIK